MSEILDRLNPKQKRVFALAIEGMSNKEIAQKLNTTHQVIKNYMWHIYNKIGMSNRGEMFHFAYSRPDLIAELKEMING